jgi:hypothetical protein
VKRTLCTLTLTFGAVVPLAAQQPGAQAPAAAPIPAPAAVSIPIGTRVGEMPTGYEDGGRRDPFASLIAPRRPTASVAVDASRGRTGLGSVALADVTVKGIVRSGSVMLAILEASNRQSFTVRPNDRLLDAHVRSIDGKGVVFAEQVGPGGPALQIRKPLRTAEDGR